MWSDERGWGGKSKGTVDPFSGTSMAVRCYESHPVLTLGTGKLYGGNAYSPVVKQADVYVVLQSGDMRGRQSDPWEKPTVTEVGHFIPDMGVPSNVARFKKLVTWLCNQLHDGKIVHVGCIGGHGRTGMVLSAIVAEMKKEKDAIQYVRKHYCPKAVESSEQIGFLMKHYGVSKAISSKGGPVVKGGPAGFRPQGQSEASVAPQEAKPGVVRRVPPPEATKATKSYGPMASTRSLWKKPTKARVDKPRG